MIESHFKLKQPLASEQLEFVEKSLRASFDLSAIQLEGDVLRIVHSDSESQDSVLGTTKRLLFIAKSLNKDLVFANDVSVQYEGDPQPALEDRREVIPVHPGFFTLQGDFLRVFHAINRIVRRMAEDVHAVEQEYPAVWPVRLFRMINYFHEFPQQVILCAPVKDDFKHRKEFAERYSEDKSFESVEMDHLMANAEYGLEPAVCDCCYYGLEGIGNLKNSFYTCYNKVFRNERSSTERLDRLTNFSVRDIMCVGTEEFVLEGRQALIERLSVLLTKLRLRARIETANDPFFANDSAMKSVFQNSHRLKYELLADIPHLGESIAVGSVNFHMDFFGKAFNIDLEGGGTASSGCIGVGMERLTYALYCQHGASLDAWPRDVLDYLELAC